MLSVSLLNVTPASPPVEGEETSSLQQVSFPDEARAFVETISPNKPINLITIWGPARTGKSFFMNALAGENGVGVFPVSGGVDPCTVGASISTTERSVVEFSQQQCNSGEPIEDCSVAGAPMIGFIDVEGQGDKHPSYDMLLATPLLLISKVVIFNWKGAPNKSSMLDHLAVMTHIAAVIGEDHQVENAFGHLIVLLRDVSPKHEERAERLLLQEEDVTSATTHMEKEHITARNDMRKLLHFAFHSVRVVCLPRPHVDIDDEEIRLEKVSPVFAEKMTELRRVLADEILLEPHCVGRQPVIGGPVLASLLTEVVSTINQGAPNLHPSSMMESVHQQLAEAAFSNGMQSFITSTAGFDGTIAMSKASMSSFLARETSAAMESFEKTTRGLGEHMVRNARERLAHAISVRVETLEARQQVQIAQALANIDRLVNGARRLVEQQGPEALPMPPMLLNGKLSSGWDMMCQNIHSQLERDIENQVGTLREDLSTAIPSLQEFTRSMQDLETRQKTEDSARREVQALKEAQAAGSSNAPKLADRITGLRAVVLDVITFGNWRSW